MERNDSTSLRQRFDAIVLESRDRLGRLARVYGGRDAEDLLQEMLMQIWRGLPRFEQRSTASTWCYRVALNTAISWKRSRNCSNEIPTGTRVDTEQLQSPLATTDEGILLHHFLATLSEIDRAVMLMYLEDLTMQEIADAIGTSQGAIRTRLSRLRQRLSNWEVGDEPD